MLNLIQHPFCLKRGGLWNGCGLRRCAFQADAACAARWMLKQVQHDEGLYRDH